MKKACIILFVFLSLQSFSRTQNATKAVFIYQFTKLINWPSQTKSGMFRIGVLGSFDAYREISDLTLGRTVGKQNIEVMNVVNISQLDLTSFHMLIVGEPYCTPENLSIITKMLIGKTTLLITHKLNFINYNACIGFTGNDKQLQYVYSQDKIQSLGLTCSKSFLQLGENHK